MTIPLSPASDRRGPRETLLALTETYLRSGELDAAGRASVAELAARSGFGAGARPSTPEWAPLAAALAAMLRGEAARALRTVIDAESGGRLPRALRGAVLGLGVRAALASERPALASRWRAQLSQREGSGLAAAAEGERGDAARRAAVLAALPALIRELLVLPELRETGPAGGGSGPAGGGGAPDAEGDAIPPGARGGTLLHLVLDAYHGDVVSLPAAVAVLAAGDGAPFGASPAGVGPGAGGAGREPGPDGRTEEGGGDADWRLAASEDGVPLLTVRVAADDPLPSRPDVAGWHVRFVGRLRAVDARTSDGSLRVLDWEPNGFVATLLPPPWLAELDPPQVLATRVTHVVVVPEV